MTDTSDSDLRPEAREDVVFRRVGDDWLLFDPRAQEIHVLNLSAALAWTFCDGERTEDQIAEEVARAFAEDEGAAPADREKAAPKSEVLEVLRGFREAGLLR